MYLEKINQPSDIKQLKIEELKQLSDETREALIHKISLHGGHNGPNLGMVEMTVALHYVFDSPIDKIVYDVSHQTYPHKILTGRKEAFLDEKHFDDVTGYTNPDESKHDFFTIGHTSTSVSLALGLAKARDLKQEKGNIICVIGDGSLSGGEALEAIDYAGEYNKNLIIIVNDNDQSIAENHGGLYKNLRELRITKGRSENNLFKAFHLDYYYLDEGHNLEKLVELFEKVKDIDHPVVLHIHTIKGKGLKFAEDNREEWHAGGAFDPVKGEYLNPSKKDPLLINTLTQFLDTHQNGVVLNAGTPATLGFTANVRKKYVENGQFVDVGIAEENMVAMASGIAKNGGIPVFGTMATFLQRAYDQLNHDLALNDNPAIMLTLSAGLYGMKVNTHTALTDIQIMTNIPNLEYYAPYTKSEFTQIFNYSVEDRNHPKGIRMPVSLSDKDYGKIDITKNKVYKQGKEIALFAVGKMNDIAFKVVEILEKENIHITHINPIFLHELDKELLESLKDNHHTIITIEDGELFGGFGVNLASYYGNSEMKVINHGLNKHFHTDFTVEEILTDHQMNVDQLVNEIKGCLK